MENQGNLEEAQASEMLSQYFAVKDMVLKVRQEYATKALEVLPATKVLRFVQIENKISALVDYKLAETIPLTK